MIFFLFCTPFAFMCYAICRVGSMYDMECGLEIKHQAEILPFPERKGGV